MAVGMEALRDGRRLSDYNILKERWKASCEPTGVLQKPLLTFRRNLAETPE